MTKMDLHKELNELVKGFPLKYYIQVHHCFNHRVPPTWEKEETLLNDFHLVYIKSGSGTYFINGKAEALEKGKCLLLFPGTVFSGKQNPQNPQNFIPVRFGVYHLKTQQMIKPYPRDSFFSFFPKRSKFVQTLLEELFRLFTLERSQLGPTPVSSCGFLLWQLLTLIEEDQSSVEKVKPHYLKKIEMARQYIEANPTKPINVVELATIAELSEKQFTRYFKKVYSDTPYQYSLNVRLHYTKFLLESTGSSLDKISEVVGYSDQYSLSRQFKEFFGVNPSSIRKRV